MSKRTSRQETRPLISDDDSYISDSDTDFGQNSHSEKVSSKKYKSGSINSQQQGADERDVELIVQNNHLLWNCIPIGCLPLSAQVFMQKQFTSANGFVLLLILLVIGLGSINRVMYKIQVTDHTMKPFAIFISDILSFAYVILYFSIFAVRYWMGIITRDMVIKPTFPWIDYKFIIMGLMDATGQILGIYAAREITGFLLTLLSQGTMPMSIVTTFILLKARYNLGQLAGAAVLIGGVIITLVPDMIDGNGGGSIIWAIVYFISSFPAAISFTLKEMVFSARPDMDIFVVNSMDSLFQMIFTLLFLPLVAVPGFGAIKFSEFGSYISNGAHCLVGISKTSESSCDGMPWATMIYVCVNLSWNISILLLVKKGGAVLTFISLAVSLPIANLAFILDWPLLPGSGWQVPEVPLDIVALFVVLLGLTTYRVFSILQKRKLDREKAEKARLEALEKGNVQDGDTLEAGTRDDTLKAKSFK